MATTTHRQNHHSSQNCGHKRWVAPLHSISADMIKSKLFGQAINDELDAIYSGHPRLARDLPVSIVRMGRVAEIIRVPAITPGSNRRFAF
jgi:hypothetical protein